MRERRSYPRHPYPLLLAVGPEGCRPVASGKPAKPLSPRTRGILSAMERGARLLFDTAHGRALLYRFGRGIEMVAELTVRTLALLVKRGYLARSGQDGRLIHYSLAR